ncbi:MAG: hypothetical protein R3E83_06455 [Burkholderiaceae bacterium]
MPFDQARPGAKRSHCMLAALAIGLVLSACGGGGGSSTTTNSAASNAGADTDTGTSGSGATTTTPGSAAGSMIITVLDGPVSRNPVAGVSISIYEADDKTIAQTIVTGADGVANFGPVAAGPAATKATAGHRTVTVAEPRTGNGHDVTTIVNLKSGSYTWYVGEQGSQSNCRQVGLITSGTFTGLGGATSAAVWPLFAGQNPLAGPAGLAAGQVANAQFTMNDVPVCASHLQSDGTLTLLVVGSDANGQVVSYGYFAGLGVSDAMNIQGDASNALSSLAWTLTTPVPANLITTSNLIGPVLFPMIGTNTNGASSGTLPFADQVPTGTLMVIASNENQQGASTCTSTETYPSKPTTAMITMPDFGPVTVNYQPADRSVALALPGPGTADIQIYSVEVSAPNSAWTIFAAGNSTLTHIPDLPAAVDIGSIDPSRSEVNLIDTSAVAGFDAVTELFMQASARPDPARLAAIGLAHDSCVYPWASAGGATGGTGGLIDDGTGNNTPGTVPSVPGSGGAGGFGSLVITGAGPLAGTFTATDAATQQPGGQIVGITFTDAAQNNVGVLVGNPDPTTAALVTLVQADGSSEIATATSGPLPVVIDYAARTVSFNGLSVGAHVLNGSMNF